MADAFDIVRQQAGPAKVTKPKNAVKDVFEMARKAVDLTTVKIERSPIPTSRLINRPHSYRQLLDRMQSGDMVRLPKWQADVLYSQAGRHKIKVVRRKISDELVAIWKV